MSGPLLGLLFVVVVPFVGVPAVLVLAVQGASRWLSSAVTRRTASEREPDGEPGEVPAGEVVAALPPSVPLPVGGAEASLIQHLVDRIGCEYVVVGRDYRVAQLFVPADAAGRDELLASVGRPCFELAHGVSSREACDAADCPVRVALETGKPARVSHLHLWRGREGRREVVVEAVPVRSPSGEVTHVATLSTPARPVAEA